MDRRGRRALYVSYNAADEAVFRSQVLPYLGELSAKGVSFTLLTFEKKDSEGGGAHEELARHGIRWVRLRFHQGPLVPVKLYDLLAGWVVTLSLCLRYRFQLVHSRGIMASIMSLAPARLTGAKFVFDMKSSLAEAYRLSGRLTERSLSYRVLSALERWCVARSDVVVVETRHHKRELEPLLGEKGEERIRVLPCCVDVGRFSRPDGAVADGDRPVRLVFLGSLSGWYMLPEMLDFYRALTAVTERAEFLFLSDDPDGAVSDLARMKDLPGITVRRVAYEDVPRELAGSTAGILFKWPDERLDSFPIKIGEYLAAGLPVVINAGMGDVEEMIRGRQIGAVVASMGRSGYQEAAASLLGLLADAPQVRTRCRDIAQKELSRSRAVATYAQIYERCFGENL